jgi:hypothetical protein
LYRFSNDKITSDVFTALLNNAFMNTGTYALKYTCINDTTVTAGCKQIRLHSGWNERHSGWNERHSGFGWLQVSYLRLNFGLGSNAPLARPGEILKFRSVEAYSYVPLSFYTHVT